jgi:MFS family permease
VNDARGLDRRFSRLWLAATVSFVGDGVMLAAFPLLAATLTDSPLLIAGAQVARWLPWLITGLFGGVLADRLDRRRMMIAVDSCRAILVAVLAVAVVGGWDSIPLLYAVAFGLGIGETFFDPAAQALLPNIVVDERLERANGRLYASESVAKELLGPAIGGALFAIAAWTPFLIDSLSFAIAALVIAGLIGSFRTVAAGDVQVASTIRKEIREGWQFLKAHALLRTLAIFGALLNLASGAVEGTLVVFALRSLHLTDLGFGLLLACAAVGGTAASLVADRVTGRVGPGVVLIGGYFMSGIAMCAAAFTSNGFVAGALLAVVFAANAFANIISFTLRQQLTPDPLRGRVTSVYRTIVTAAIPIGALFGGLIAEHFNIRGPILAFGIISLLVSAAATLWTNDRVIAAARAAVAAPVTD